MVFRNDLVDNRVLWNDNNQNNHQNYFTTQSFCLSLNLQLIRRKSKNLSESAKYSKKIWLIGNFFQQNNCNWTQIMCKLNNNTNKCVDFQPFLQPLYFATGSFEPRKSKIKLVLSKIRTVWHRNKFSTTFHFWFTVDIRIQADSNTLAEKNIIDFSPCFRKKVLGKKNKKIDDDLIYYLSKTNQSRNFKFFDFLFRPWQTFAFLKRKG